MALFLLCFLEFFENDLKVIFLFFSWRCSRSTIRFIKQSYVLSKKTGNGRSAKGNQLVSVGSYRKQAIDRELKSYLLT